MTAPNHAITGALIGLSIPTLWIAIPLAIASHFVLDALPHYDVPGETDEGRINSKQFVYVQLLGGFMLCLLLVMALWVFHPEHWLGAAVCAFAAASPDLLSIPRFISVKQRGIDPTQKYWFWRFHRNIQKNTGEQYAPVEIIWASVGVMILTIKLHS